MSSNQRIESLRIRGLVRNGRRKLLAMSQIDPWKTWTMHRYFISCQSKVLDDVVEAWNHTSVLYPELLMKQLSGHYRLYLCVMEAVTLAIYM